MVELLSVFIGTTILMFLVGYIEDRNNTPSYDSFNQIIIIPWLISGALFLGVFLFHLFHIALREDGWIK